MASIRKEMLEPYRNMRALLFKRDAAFNSAWAGKHDKDSLWNVSHPLFKLHQLKT